MHNRLFLPDQAGRLLVQHAYHLSVNLSTVFGHPECSFELKGAYCPSLDEDSGDTVLHDGPTANQLAEQLIRMYARAKGGVQ